MTLCSFITRVNNHIAQNQPHSRPARKYPLRQILRRRGVPVACGPQRLVDVVETAMTFVSPCERRCDVMITVPDKSLMRTGTSNRTWDMEDQWIQILRLLIIFQALPDNEPSLKSGERSDTSAVTSKGYEKCRQQHRPFRYARIIGAGLGQSGHDYASHQQ